MFVTKNRYNCLQKQSIIDNCTLAFREFEQHGFEFGKFGYAGNHVHFSANVPKKYSILVAEIMLKSRSSKRLFEKHLNLRKRYPRGSFWSGYEHHESTGRKDLETSHQYIEDQQRHHNIKIIDDRQQRLDVLSAG